MHRVKSLFAVAVLLCGTQAFGQAAVPGVTIDPLTIPKFVTPLTVPPAMPAVVPGAAVYDIAVREITQQVLPPVDTLGNPLGRTKVWAYGAVNDPATFNYPAFTIEATQGVPTTVTWRNELVDPATGDFLPHLLPVDPTLHWANPPGPVDSVPVFQTTPGPYTGPVPIITHLHGGHIEPESDGYPEAWYLPAAANIVPCPPPPAIQPPGCFFTRGSNYGTSPNAPPPPAGAANAYYINNQRAATLWYHDHSLGMTRTNVYTGLAGFYLLRDAYEKTLNLPSGAYEVPLAIQDRTFKLDGSLFYPDSRTFFDGFGPCAPGQNPATCGPYLPFVDPAGNGIAPIWNPEFFGDTMVVNGKTWPQLTVEARKYRFRLLNGCDSRFLALQIANKKGKAIGAGFTVIGNDGGFLTGAPVRTKQLVIGPGERYDVIVDFSVFTPGTRVLLINVAPDAPFGGYPVDPLVAANPLTTGQVMAFDVVAPAAPDTSVIPVTLAPPPDGFEPKPVVTRARTLTLTEIVADFWGPAEAHLGDANGPLEWDAPITENVVQNATEEWSLVNRTVDAHPIHLHQVQFQVVSRQPIDLVLYDAALADCAAGVAGAVCPPDPTAFVLPGTVPAAPFPYEMGPKDTVITNPGEITKVKAFFDIPGLYVWHCHILSHEDNEMMRPVCVTSATVPACTK